MAHKGIREFEAVELSGVALGQNGFKVIGDPSSAVEVTCGSGGTAGYTDINYFVAFKAVNDDAIVEARSVTGGDDFTTNSGVYNGSSPITILNGDIVYGAFDKLDVTGGDYIIAYIGI